MGEHTQGPWQAEANAGRGAWIKGSTGEWAALSCGDTDERARANARLIAAAPDLLAALEQAWPYVPDHHGPIQHQIKTALAKARGEP